MFLRHAASLLIVAAVVAATPLRGRAAPPAAAALVELTFAGTWSAPQKEELQRALGGALAVAGLPVIDAARVARVVAVGTTCRTDRCRIDLARRLGVGRLVYGHCRREARGLSLRLVLFNAAVGERTADLSRFVPSTVALAPALVGASRALLAREPRARGGVLRVRSRPPGASITVDGRPLGKTDADLPIATGAHVLVLQRPGAAPVETRVTVHPGQTTAVDITLQGSAPGEVVTAGAATGGTVGGTVGAPPSGAPDPATDHRRSHRADGLRPLRLWAYGVGAAGVAALATGTTLYALGCSPEEPYRQCPVHPGVRTSGIVLLAVGGALTATGLGLWLYDRRRHRARVTLAPGGATLTVLWP